MARRHKIGKKQSKRLFTNTALNIHPKNVRQHPMRGGIRL